MENITAAQAATLTGYSERTIRRKIASGELPARRVATNRFAIDVRDLPRRWNGHDVERRLEALERRVQLLEEGQRILFQQLGQQAKETNRETGAEPLPTSAGEQDASITTLHELLVQLAQETERLTPFFAPEERQDEQHARHVGERRARARLRPLPSDSAAQQQES